MGWFNNLFNTIKNGVRNVGGTIKSIASSVASGARFFSAIPIIGNFASGIATVADAVGTGVDVANGIVNLGEGIQKGFGLDTGNAPAPQAQVNRAPTSTAMVRRPISLIRQRPRVSVSA